MFLTFLSLFLTFSRRFLVVCIHFFICLFLLSHSHCTHTVCMCVPSHTQTTHAQQQKLQISLFLSVFFVSFSWKHNHKRIPDVFLCYSCLFSVFLCFFRQISYFLTFVFFPSLNSENFMLVCFQSFELNFAFPELIFGEHPL